MQFLIVIGKYLLDSLKQIGQAIYFILEILSIFVKKGVKRDGTEVQEANSEGTGTGLWEL